MVETGDDVEMVMQVVDDDEERMMELVKLLFPVTV